MDSLIEDVIEIGNKGTMKITTYPSGKHINVLDLQPEDIDIFDIAHATANICRYNGHVSHFYSVAQHSVIVSQQFDDLHLRKWGLLHDAGEAYLGDFIAPLKYCGRFDYYHEAEALAMTVIAEKFGLGDIEPPEVKEVDLKLRGAEMRDLKNYEPIEETYDFKITGWYPNYAKVNFLDEALKLGLIDEFIDYG